MSVTTMEINPPVGSPRMRFFMLIHDCTEREQGGGAGGWVEAIKGAGRQQQSGEWVGVWAGQIGGQGETRQAGGLLVEYARWGHQRFRPWML